VSAGFQGCCYQGPDDSSGVARGVLALVANGFGHALCFRPGWCSAMCIGDPLRAGSRERKTVFRSRISGLAEVVEARKRTWPVRIRHKVASPWPDRRSHPVGHAAYGRGPLRFPPWSCRSSVRTSCLTEQPAQNALHPAVRFLFRFFSFFFSISNSASEYAIWNALRICRPFHLISFLFSWMSKCLSANRMMLSASMMSFGGSGWSGAFDSICSLCFSAMVSRSFRMLTWKISRVCVLSRGG
jgi:hypothetical protein